MGFFKIPQEKMADADSMSEMNQQDSVAECTSEEKVRRIS